MVREFLFNLFKNGQILNLIFILLIYVINYIIVFKFGNTIIRLWVSYKTLLITSFIVGFCTLFLKAFLQELVFGLINSLLIILTFFYYSQLFTLKSFVKSCWTFLVISIIMGLFMGVIFQPLLYLLPFSLYNSVIGIVLGTVIEFSPLLILLLCFSKKWERMINKNEK